MASDSIHARALAKSVRAIFHQVPTFFLRRRKTGPRQALLVLLASIASGADRIGVRAARLEVILGFFGGMLANSGSVSSSAVARSVRKLTLGWLEPALDRGLREVAATFGTRALIHGRRLVAIDGVRINSTRTPSLARRLGRPKLGQKKRAHQPQAIVVMATCVVTGITLAQAILRCDGSERVGARTLLDRLQSMGPMTLLFDRGFPSHAFIALLQERRIRFVMRLPTGSRAWKETRHLLPRASADERISLRVRGSDDGVLPTTLRAVLSPRAKRGRPRCGRTPQRMLLLTDCFASKTESIIALYHRRWDIEIAIRENKRLLGAVRMRSRTPAAFEAELLAYAIYRILMALVVGAASAPRTAPCWNDRHASRHNTPQAILLAWRIVLLVLGRRRSHLLLDLLLDQCARDAAKRRPGRTFRRICRGSEGRWKERDESWRA